MAHSLRWIIGFNGMPGIKITSPVKKKPQGEIFPPRGGGGGLWNDFWLLRLENTPFFPIFSWRDHLGDMDL